MRIKEVKFMQQGGPMAAPAAEPAAAPAAEMGAPAEGGAPQGGAEDQLAQLAGQLLEMLLQQLQDPQAVMAVLEAAMQMLQEGMGQSAPVFKSGGKLKAKGGCKMKVSAKKK